MSKNKTLNLKIWETYTSHATTKYCVAKCLTLWKNVNDTMSSEKASFQAEHKIELYCAKKSTHMYTQTICIMKKSKNMY